MTKAVDDYSSAAFKRLERTRRTKAGWSHDHYAHLFEGFGFVRKEGKEHAIYYEPGHPDNFVIVPRHRRLKPYLAEQAVGAVDTMLIRRKGQQ